MLCAKFCSQLFSLCCSSVCKHFACVVENLAISQLGNDGLSAAQKPNYLHTPTSATNQPTRTFCANTALAPCPVQTRATYHRAHHPTHQPHYIELHWFALYFGKGSSSSVLWAGPCGIPENTGIPGLNSNTDTGIFENKIPVFSGILV